MDSESLGAYGDVMSTVRLRPIELVAALALSALGAAIACSSSGSGGPPSCDTICTHLASLCGSEPLGCSTSCEAATVDEQDCANSATTCAESEACVSTTVVKGDGGSVPKGDGGSTGMDSSTVTDSGTSPKGGDASTATDAASASEASTSAEGGSSSGDAGSSCVAFLQACSTTGPACCSDNGGTPTCNPDSTVQGLYSCTFTTGGPCGDGTDCASGVCTNSVCE